MAINIIICATKGSEECKKAEDKAIELALENNSRLIFLYIIDVEQMEKGGDVSEGAIEDIEPGLKNIGNIILENASGKAIEKGIPQDKILSVETIGNFLNEIKTHVENHKADLFIVGHSHAKAGLLERLLLSKDKPEVFEKKIKEVLKCQTLVV